MKINNIGSSGVNPYNREYNKIETAKTANVKADKLEISSTAKELQQSLQIPAERQAKVDELKNKLESGTYKVNVHETAKSIIDYYFKK
ncbi:flagellar biosynthesis anti-sigma factor FlgM [Bacillus sp. V59.32b]|uniref:flagellar biosynthesis anti-sigma factor FlgM n=1 Tax=Bacillus sp. V59.32b TaxID=1758642 RepID=UPI000E3D37F9|nr:flagellar biosynthesis anti-sigma factor FlgM [Bacillus sp. V59.32b]RFU67417.1 flagellar biosynthesis anti-sigma factor FlgM [Bacillus sp. V59.32b]